MRSQLHESDGLLRSRDLAVKPTAETPASSCGLPSLEPSVVDEAFADESVTAPREQSDRRELDANNGFDGAHSLEPASKSRLLQSLAVQLANLESQQRRIRRILEAVERAK